MQKWIRAEANLASTNMKMLFFSSDLSEVKQANKELLEAGVRCEIRNSSLTHGRSSNPSQAELWIQNDRDCHRAFLLCVQLGIGFAKRGTNTSLVVH